MLQSVVTSDGNFECAQIAATLGLTGAPSALQTSAGHGSAHLPWVGAFYLSCLSFLPAVCFENAEAQGLCSSLWESILRFTAYSVWFPKIWLASLM